MLDTAFPLLLYEIIDNSPAFIRVDLDGVFVDIVQQIKVKVVHAAFFELFFKDRGGIVAAAELMPRILGGKVITLSGIAGQRSPNHLFRHPAVIGVCGVKVIDAVGNGVVHHFIHLFFVNLSRISTDHRQAHCAEAQP